MQHLVKPLSWMLHYCPTLGDSRRLAVLLTAAPTMGQCSQALSHTQERDQPPCATGVLSRVTNSCTEPVRRRAQCPPSPRALGTALLLSAASMGAIGGSQHLPPRSGSGWSYTLGRGQQAG